MSSSAGPIDGISRRADCSFLSASNMSLLVSLDIEPLSSQVEKACKLQLICVIRRSHEERATSIFNDLQSERREIVKFEERNDRAAPLLLVVHFQFPFGGHRG
jgi:hypothetical protein